MPTIAWLHHSSDLCQSRESCMCSTVMRVLWDARSGRRGRWIIAKAERRQLIACIISGAISYHSNIPPPKSHLLDSMPIMPSLSVFWGAYALFGSSEPGGPSLCMWRARSTVAGAGG
jgi:hypothetical protein